MCEIDYLHNLLGSCKIVGAHFIWRHFQDGSLVAPPSETTATSTTMTRKRRHQFVALLPSYSTIKHLECDEKQNTFFFYPGQKLHPDPSINSARTWSVHFRTEAKKYRNSSSRRRGNNLRKRWKSYWPKTSLSSEFTG